MQKKYSSSQSIGIFDSGVGGLTVMQEIIHKLPLENLIYFGDTARVPYGPKSPETIVRYSIESAIFLLEQDIKVLVVACNTAASCSIEKLRQIFNLPIVGVIEPGAEKAAVTTKNGKIAVLGTKATINSGIYQKEIIKRLPTAEITSIACPLFVPIVEEKFTDHEAARIIVREYLKPIKDKAVDTILLGCTHYPLIAHLIKEEMGDKVTIVDSGATCAEKVKEILTSLNLANSSKKPFHKYFVSDDPIKFKMLGSDFLGLPIDEVCKYTNNL